MASRPVALDFARISLRQALLMEDLLWNEGAAKQYDNGYGC